MNITVIVVYCVGMLRRIEQRQKDNVACAIGRYRPRELALEKTRLSGTKANQVGRPDIIRLVNFHLVEYQSRTG